LRGLAYFLIALFLVIASGILIGSCQPAVGAKYAILPRLVIYLMTIGGWALLLMGLFRLIVGPGVGTGAGILKVIAIVLVGVVGLGALFETWVVHSIVSSARPSSSGDGDWDWDD
jgi:hypothetical protein